MKTIPVLVACCSLLVASLTTLSHAQKPVNLWSTAAHSRAEHIAVSDDGKTFASSSYDDKTLKVWDIATGQLIQVINVNLSGGNKYDSLHLSETGANLRGVFLPEYSGSFYRVNLKAPPLLTYGVNAYVAETYDEHYGIGMIWTDDDTYPHPTDSVTVIAVARFGYDPDSVWASEYTNKFSGIYVLRDNSAFLTIIDSTSQVRAFTLPKLGHAFSTPAIPSKPRCLYLAQDGDTYYAYCKDDSVRAYSIKGKGEKILFCRYVGPRAQFSPSGDRYMVTEDYKHIAVYRTADGSQLHTLDLSEHGIREAKLFCTPDSVYKILCLSVPMQITLWDVATGKLEQTYFHHTGAVTQLTFNPQGTEIYCASSSVITCHSVETGSLLRVFPAPSNRGIGKLEMAPAGDYLYVWDGFAGTNSTIYKLKLPEGEVVRSGFAEFKSGSATDNIFLTSTGDSLIVKHSYDSIFILDANLDRLSAVKLPVRGNYGIAYSRATGDYAQGQGGVHLYKHNDFVTEPIEYDVYPDEDVMSFSHDGTKLAVCNVLEFDSQSRSEYEIIDIPTGKQVKYKKPLPHATKTIGWSGDGSVLYCLAHRYYDNGWRQLGKIFAINITTGDTLYSMKAGAGFSSFASPAGNGKYFATGSYDGTIDLWCTGDCPTADVRPAVSGYMAPGICISPNPARSTITFTLPEAAVAEVEVIDTKGRKLISRQFTNVAIATLEIAGLVPGPYCLQIFCNNTFARQLFIKY